MIGALSSALQGMFTQKERVNEAAQKIAEFPVETQKAQEFVGSGAADPSSFEGYEIDLAQQIVTLQDASTLYKANAAVIRTEGEMQDAMLDVFS